MSDLHFVGPWDLDRELACVPDRPEDGPVVMVESVAKGQALPFHRQKLVMVLSAMHHFADELRADGYDVHVVNAPTYVEGIAEVAKRVGATRVPAMMPREWGMQQALEASRGALSAELVLHDDAARGVTPPPLPRHEPDPTTTAMMERVAAWSNLWGSVDGFDWPVTRAGALRELDSLTATAGRSTTTPVDPPRRSCLGWPRRCGRPRVGSRGPRAWPSFSRRERIVNAR